MKMGKIILLAITYIFLFAEADCKKKKDCHSEVLISNKSNQNVIPAFKFTDPSNKCILSGSVIKPNESYKDATNGCWEDKLINGINLDFYIVDPTKYNNPNVFYNCDSIEIKNTVLKHYVLTLEDLKKTNFTVTYP